MLNFERENFIYGIKYQGPAGKFLHYEKSKHDRDRQYDTGEYRRS